MLNLKATDDTVNKCKKKKLLNLKATGSTFNNNC